MPEMTLTSVDLPAPLSPTRPTTSPAWISRSTPSSAWTAPNRLLTPWRASRGELMATPPDPVRLAGAREGAGADLRLRPEAVLDDRRGDVRLGDRHRRQESRT